MGCSVSSILRSVKIAAAASVSCSGTGRQAGHAGEILAGSDEQDLGPLVVQEVGRVEEPKGVLPVRAQDHVQALHVIGTPGRSEVDLRPVREVDVAALPEVHHGRGRRSAGPRHRHDAAAARDMAC